MRLKMLRRVFMAAGVVALLYMALQAFRQLGPWGPAIRMQETARRMIGRTEAELVAALGQPRHIVTAAEVQAGKSVNDPWAGMNFVPVPTHPVRNRVLLYSDFNLAAYVFIDPGGRVERVATAGT